jgi:hypothetical protein
MMTPFQRFLNGLNAAQLDFNETMTELRAFAEVMAHKKNSIELDEDGCFYVSASGPLEEVINTVQKHLERLKRINEERSNYR